MHDCCCMVLRRISSYPAETTERLQGSDCSDFQQPEKRQYISILTTATVREQRERDDRILHDSSSLFPSGFTPGSDWGQRENPLWSLSLWLAWFIMPWTRRKWPLYYGEGASLSTQIWLSQRIHEIDLAALEWCVRVQVCLEDVWVWSAFLWITAAKGKSIIYGV